MRTDPTGPPARGPLIGRRRECAAIDALLAGVGVGDGHGSVLVLRGEAGVGKTSLLDYAAGSASGFQVVRVTGCQAEAELAFGGLHKLLAPLLEGLEALPGPQRSALETVFGISAGPAPGTLLVGLAALTLLTNAAEHRPLVCLIDDEHWLDRASAQVLLFAARRLDADAVGVILAGREASSELAGLEAQEVVGLSDGDAQALLDAALIGPIDPEVRDQIVREARGNPMALLELPLTVTVADLAGGAGLPGGMGAADRIEVSFGRRFADLPADTRRLLHIAAASGVEDTALLSRAARRTGIDLADATAAIEAGLIELGETVRFHHPLVRSAVLLSATEAERREAHAALAAATDPGADADRRAWHRGQATREPDDEVAAELESSAEGARSRGGHAAAAAFLRRAAELTSDRGVRARRLLTAAQLTREAGALDLSESLLTDARHAPLSDGEHAASDHLAGQIAFDRLRVREASDLLSEAAGRLETIDMCQAREAHLEALVAAIWTGEVSSAGRMRSVASAALAVPLDLASARTVDRLLEALAVLVRDGHAAAVPAIGDTFERLLAEPADGEGSRWLLRHRVALILALERCDDRGWHTIAKRQADLGRRVGAAVYLRWALDLRAWTEIHRGELTAAALTLEHSRSVAQAAGERSDATVDLVLGAWRGESARVTPLIDATRLRAGAGGAGRLVDFALYAQSVLGNGVGDHRTARDAAWQVFAHDPPGLGVLVVAELLEAASRTGHAELLQEASAWLSARSRTVSTSWLAGLHTRAQALAADGDAADALFRASLAHLGRSQARLELARGQLLYGEWLRRARRRADARTQLRSAYTRFSEMGAAGFAGRAERELAATGESLRLRDPTTRDDLTAREAQVARLARDGLSNPEVAARLFISPHTVQYHLRKVFTKLDIQSRVQLLHVLSPD